jgi:hypothetical protein
VILSKVSINRRLTKTHARVRAHTHIHTHTHTIHTHIQTHTYTHTHIYTHTHTHTHTELDIFYLQEDYISNHEKFKNKQYLELKLCHSFKLALDLQFVG